MPTPSDMNQNAYGSALHQSKVKSKDVGETLREVEALAVQVLKQVDMVPKEKSDDAYWAKGRPKQIQKQASMFGANGLADHFQSLMVCCAAFSVNSHSHSLSLCHIAHKS